MATMTVKRLLGQQTVRYRAKYLRMFRKGRSKDDFDYWVDRPEHLIPGHDHCLQIGPYLVSRPYGMYLEKLEELVVWAKEHGLEVQVDAPSSWHPATILVQVYRQEFSTQFWERVKEYGDAFEASMNMLVYYRQRSQITRVRKKWNNHETGVYVLRSTVTTEHEAAQPMLKIGDYVKPERSYRLGDED